MKNRALLICTLAFSLLSTSAYAYTVVYDATQTFIGNPLTFDLYQPVVGETVTSVTVELILPTSGSFAADNENEYSVDISRGSSAWDIMVSSTDVTFPIIDFQPISLTMIVTLGPHDDPDSIDTLDAFQADSGDDWIQMLGLSVLPIGETVLNPDDIATFLGSGTFSIDCQDDTIYNLALIPEGVSVNSSLIAAGYDIRVSMTAMTPVPEPATMFLFGIGLLGIAGVNRRKK